jgi:lycopene cyclase domain-containing protein
MTYTMLAAAGLLTAIAIDRWVFGTRMIRRVDFWLAYLIIGFFQLVTNGILTGRQVVQYRDSAIAGVGNDGSELPFLGGGRVAFAPFEDLLFGFAFVLSVSATWVWLARRGWQHEPTSGPPRWRQ